MYADELEYAFPILAEDETEEEESDLDGEDKEFGDDEEEDEFGDEEEVSGDEI